MNGQFTMDKWDKLSSILTDIKATKLIETIYQNTDWKRNICDIIKEAVVKYKSKETGP